ncbi:MAG: NUDIX hydrolase [Dehalococcoidia bacterium]|nr:NUDIX hydrolase [Dehalococcoidia bacterium]
MESDPAADEFLRHYSPVDVETDVSWRTGEIELTISSYITCDEPPPQLVTSVRALVFRDESILLMQNVNGPHIIPGGRVESGESHLDALRRELIEEAGVEITDVRPLGFMHLRHETPKPPNYPYLYPDLFWPIFVAEYDGESEQTRVQDDYELSSEFIPLGDLDRSILTEAELVYLDHVVSARKRVLA